MNKLNELAMLASEEAWSVNHYNGSSEFSGYTLNREKFAELIIADLKNMLKLHGSHFDWVSAKFEERLLKDTEK